jgi:hypothetical protein
MIEHDIAEIGLPYTTIKTAMKIEAKPAQVIQPIFWNVLMLARMITTMVARNDHQTVQAP